MQLTVFNAEEGDCLLITSEDGKHILFDGGTSSAYKKNISGELASKVGNGNALDIVCITHWDSDHNAGILQLLKDILDWKVYDYHSQTSGSKIMKPKCIKPPNIENIWRNAFRDQFEENYGEITNLLAFSTNVLADKHCTNSPSNEFRKLELSEKSSLEIGYLINARRLKIPVNDDFNNRLITVEAKKKPVYLGSMKITVVSPMNDDIERLRDNWNRWLTKKKAIIKEVREQSEKDIRRLGLDEGAGIINSRVCLSKAHGEGGNSVPNQASLVFLVEENGHSILMTGDAESGHILNGLKKIGRIDDNKGMHVNILKVQHHGASANVSDEFCRYVTADHYIFCSNGRNSNPEEDVINKIFTNRTGVLAKTSLGSYVNQNFKFWFTCPVPVEGKKDYEIHMTKIEKLIKELASKSNGQMTYEFLDKDVKHEIML